MNSKFKVGDFVILEQTYSRLWLKSNLPCIGKVKRLPVQDSRFFHIKFPYCREIIRCFENEFEKVDLTKAEEMLWVLENEN